MHFAIVGRPEFRFSLTIAEVEALIRLSQLHYDWKCKLAGHRGQRDDTGLLVHWLNRLQTEEEIKAMYKETGESYESPALPLSASFNDLDLVLKITEIWVSGGGNDPDNEIACRVHFAFRGVLQHANDTLYPLWKSTFEYRKP